MHTRKTARPFLAARMLAMAIPISLIWSQEPSFEVASVKVADPSLGRRLLPVRGGPGTADPTRIAYTNMTLGQLLYYAYGALPSQISGPARLGTEHYTITAVLAQGLTKEQASQMLRSLLLQRFELSVHWQETTVSGYWLEAGKNLGRSIGGRITPTVDASMPSGNGRSKANDTYPTLDHPGMIYPFLVGSGDRAIHLMAKGQTFSDLARFLSEQLHAPTIDHTGNAVPYDFNLDFAVESNGHLSADAQQTEEQSYPSIGSAVEEQLGLKLRSAAVPKRMLIVDKANKTPLPD